MPGELPGVRDTSEKLREQARREDVPREKRAGYDAWVEKKIARARKRYDRGVRTGRLPPPLKRDP